VDAPSAAGYHDNVIAAAPDMKSINRTILTFAVLATLVPSLGLGMLSFWRHQVVIRENVSHELRTLAADGSAELTAWLRERVGELRTLSTAYVLADGLTGSAPLSGPPRIGPRQVKLYLGSVQKKLEPLLELTLSDASGRIVASSSASPAPIAVPANWPDSAVTDGIVVVPPQWDDARATATVTVIVPVLSMRNELLGALSAVLDVATARPRLQNVGQTSHAEIVLLAADGKPLLGTRSTPSELTPFDARALRQLRAHPGEALAVTGHHRRDVLAVVDVPRSLPATVVAERDRAEVFAAWIGLLEVFLLLTAALTLIVGSIAFWMGRSIVTPLNGLIAAADGVARGDLDVRLSDARVGEIGHLTRVFNLMTDRLRSGRAEILAAHEALRAQNQLLERLAVTDALTGLCNRTKLADILADEFARFRRRHAPFAVLMLDVDNFKSINDAHGHAAGDRVLADVAAVLRQSIRSIDYAARYGGEEFVLVLVETSSDSAVGIAERVRSLIEAAHTDAGNQRMSVTVSVGVAHSRERDAGPDDVLARADDALYEAKRGGRNRVRCAR
jgi:diguanylate cyclase (GGDEF)-like protein